jgi:hypothetical protein
MGRTIDRRRWLGIAALVLVLLACGVDRSVMMTMGDAMVEAGTMMHDAAAPDAAAQVGQVCAQWEVPLWTPRDTCSYTNPVSVLDGETCEVPAGWEPFHSGYDDLSSFQIRRCTRWE